MNNYKTKLSIYVIIISWRKLQY